jgi:hypothetical protein
MNYDEWLDSITPITSTDYEWWGKESMENAERLHGEEAEKMCNEFDPHRKYVGAYIDVLERLTYKRKMNELR